MAETTPSESKPESPSQELPIPKLETPSAGSSPSSVDPEALTEAILKKLEPILDKKLQSTKDKRIANIERQLGLRELSELEEAGVQIPDNVKLEYRLRQLEQGRGSSDVPTQTTTSQGSGATLTTQDVSEVVKGYQLDANDPNVIEALRGTYRNRDHFEAAMAKLALAKISKPPSSAANAPTPPSKPTPPTDAQEEIEKGYREDMAKVRRGDVNAAANVRAKWRKLAREKGFQLNV